MTALAIARLRHRPLAIAACAAFAALMTGGVVNALFLQTHRHPAPLFHSAPQPAPQPAAAARPAPAPAPAPVAAAKPEASAPARNAAPRETSIVAREVTPPARPAELGAAKGVEAKSKNDAIGALLRSGAPAAETGVSPRTVLAAQKALAKLGYDVKPDGVMGAATRQAIEKFERSQKLAVTGELGARNVKKLAAASGLAVE